MSAPALCWDIDGTLLSTARAGVYALEKAALEVTGKPLDLQAMSTAGLTDVEITRLILARHGVPPTAENGGRFLRIYEDALPASLHRRQGQVMPGVRLVLAALQSRPTWRSILLTGNTRAGARAKLTHYGLIDYFNLSEGAFSDNTSTRTDIAVKALALLRAADSSIFPGRIVVIGDTPHDVACARAIGARCLAVATGGYTLDQLQATGADRVIPTLPAPEEFFSLVEELC